MLQTVFWSQTLCSLFSSCHTYTPINLFFYSQPILGWNENVFLYCCHLHPLSIHWNTAPLTLILTHHLTGFFTINHSMFSKPQEDLLRECYLVTPLFQFAMYKLLGQGKEKHLVLLVWFPSQPPQIAEHPALPTIHSDKRSVLTYLCRRSNPHPARGIQWWRLFHPWQWGCQLLSGSHL